VNLSKKTHQYFFIIFWPYQREYLFWKDCKKTKKIILEGKKKSYTL